MNLEVIKVITNGHSLIMIHHQEIKIYETLVTDYVLIMVTIVVWLYIIESIWGGNVCNRTF